MSTKVALITGASRGIGAESAVALARLGYRVAITARTLAEGERHDHVGSDAPLPGSLEATAAAVERAGGEALCLRADILDEQSMVDAALQAQAHFGHIDLLFNNAVYQGEGNLASVLDVTREQLERIYQAEEELLRAELKASKAESEAHSAEADWLGQQCHVLRLQNAELQRLLRR